MKNLKVELIKNLPTGDEAVEIVERKGTGHPDFICDSIMESISIALSRAYLDTFGRVLHHNIDKGLLSAGSVEKGFGGGKVTSPMELIIGDRATFSAGGKEVPVVDIAEEAVGAWFAANLKKIDPRRHLKINCALRPGSEELAGIFERKAGEGAEGGGVMVANDTSAAVGYAPFTPTEKAVFETERFLNSPEFETRFPWTGRDVKVMGFRKSDELDLTVAMPLMAEAVTDERDYFRKKDEVMEALMEYVSGFPFPTVSVGYNTLDRPGGGTGGVYLSLLGTSAEDADSGQVGRGNRVNGVISLNRPMGTEAAAGKNPTSHPGKIYSVLAHRMAAEIYERTEGAAEVYVWLLSQIGTPLDCPKEVSVRVVPKGRLSGVEVEKTVEDVVEEYFSRMAEFTAELANGDHPVC
jgi:S-adenosylmethionine synthetase